MEVRLKPEDGAVLAARVRADDAATVCSVGADRAAGGARSLDLRGASSTSPKQLKDAIDAFVTAYKRLKPYASQP